MKFKIYTIDIDTETMSTEQVEKSLLLVLNELEPQIGVNKVEYKVDHEIGDATFRFYRDAPYTVIGGWVMDNDATILNVLGPEYLVPKCYGGEGYYYPVVPMSSHYYATEEQVMDFWMNKFAGEGVEDIGIKPTDEYLEVYIYKDDEEDEY